MKYKNIEARGTWERQWRRRKANSKQAYELAGDLQNRQESIEKQIEEKREFGIRLTKRMRSYENSKNRANASRPFTRKFANRRSRKAYEIRNNK